MDYRKSTSRYMITFVGEWCHDNLDYKIVLLYLLHKQNILLLQKVLRSSCGCKNSYKSWNYHKKNVYSLIIISEKFDW